MLALGGDPRRPYAGSCEHPGFDHLKTGILPCYAYERATLMMLPANHNRSTAVPAELRPFSGKAFVSAHPGGLFAGRTTPPLSV